MPAESGNAGERESRGRFVFSPLPLNDDDLPFFALLRQPPYLSHETTSYHRSIAPLALRLLLPSFPPSPCPLSVEHPALARISSHPRPNFEPTWFLLL